MHGRRLPPASPNAAMAAGIGFVPEDRRQQGLVMPLSLERNMALASLGAAEPLPAHPAPRRAPLRERVGDAPAARYGRLSDPAWTLSGGNQQKVVLAKWLAREPSLLIVDEPTRGIDVGTKAEVHRLLSDLANQGVAILMISSELPEVLGMADRVIVLFEGRVARRVRPQRGRRGLDHARGRRASARGGRMSGIDAAVAGAPRGAARTTWPRSSCASASSASCSRS